MVDAIIDTNVLIVGSLAAGGAVADSHRTEAECERVFEWLRELRASDACIVLDNGMKMFDEYHNKLTAQDYGLLVVYEKMERWFCRLHEIEYEPTDGETAVVPEQFGALDRSDRKFLAVALADIDAGHTSEIVNATDTDDWNAIAAVCAVRGVRFNHLLDGPA